MKKRFLLLLVLTLLFALTGCSDEEALNFDINKEAAINYVKAVVNSYNEVSDFEYDYYINDGLPLEKTAVSGFRAAQTTDNVGAFKGFDTTEDNVTFTNGARGNVLCSIICKYENRDVKVTVSFTENRAYNVYKDKVLEQLNSYATQNGVGVMDYIKYYYADYGYDMTNEESFIAGYIIDQYQQYPFNADECEVSPVYSKSELIEKAGINTAIGMGVVFAVLIFIAFIIYLLRFVPMLLTREITPEKNQEKKDARSTEEKKVVVSPAKSEQPKAAGGELVGDAQLVAVITAAINAYIEGTAGAAGTRGPVTTDSKDKLIVRSIRRVR